jgi:ligand-binding SRPBCC domain-containing protein
MCLHHIEERGPSPCRISVCDGPCLGATMESGIYTSTMVGAPTTTGRGASPEQQRKRWLSFTTEQWVPFPVERVFAFFADPQNLPRLMPPWQDARIDSMELQTPESRGISHVAARGSRILLSFRPVPLSPIRLRWLALIDDYVTDHHFCDLQVTGPFRYWRHCHLVNAEMHGNLAGTRVTDVVDYAWPGGSAGSVIDLLGGRLQIRQVFRYRQRRFLHLLGKEIAAGA